MWLITLYKFYLHNFIIQYSILQYVPTTQSLVSLYLNSSVTLSSLMSFLLWLLPGYYLYVGDFVCVFYIPHVRENMGCGKITF